MIVVLIEVATVEVHVRVRPWATYERGQARCVHAGRRGEVRIEGPEVGRERSFSFAGVMDSAGPSGGQEELFQRTAIFDIQLLLLSFLSWLNGCTPHNPTRILLSDEILDILNLKK